MMTNTTTYYSTNDEQFTHDTAGDAIDELYNTLLFDKESDLIGLEYYSHEFRKVNLADYIDIDDVLERADEHLYDNVSNEDGSWNAYDVSNEEKTELKELLKVWCDKHIGDRGIWEPIGKSTTYIVTAEDITNE